MEKVEQTFDDSNCWARRFADGGHRSGKRTENESEFSNFAPYLTMATLIERKGKHVPERFDRNSSGLKAAQRTGNPAIEN